MARPGYFLVAAANVAAARLLPHGELQLELREPVDGYSRVTLQAGVLPAVEGASVPTGDGAHDADVEARGPSSRAEVG